MAGLSHMLRRAALRPLVVLACTGLFATRALAADASHADERALVPSLSRYLKDWYGAFRKAYWHESHKGPEGGDFFGYWAVEVSSA